MLELGKYYQQRDGVIVGPLESHKSSSIGFEDYAFKAIGNYNSSFAVRIWKANGSFNIDDSEGNFDLISEVQFKPLDEQSKEETMSKPLKIEVGKYYKDRDGDVRGPMKASDHPIYSFTDGNLIWIENGNFYEIGESNYDLIKEVPNPNQESETTTEQTAQTAQAEATSKFKEISLTEALEVLKNEGRVFVTSGSIFRELLGRYYDISWILDATKFEIEVKPVVKYLVAFIQSGDDTVEVSHSYFESLDAFYTYYSHTTFDQAELIQFTRKEF